MASNGLQREMIEREAACDCGADDFADAAAAAAAAADSNDLNWTVLIWRYRQAAESWPP